MTEHLLLDLVTTARAARPRGRGGEAPSARRRPLRHLTVARHIVLPTEPEASCTSRPARRSDREHVKDQLIVCAYGYPPESDHAEILEPAV